MRGLQYYGNYKTIIYVGSIEEAAIWSDILGWINKLLNMEINCNIIDYKTSKLNRMKFIYDFINGNNYQILINLQILNEGLDIPECDSIFITKSNNNAINLIQRMCRCNRICQNKSYGYIFLWNKKNIDNLFIDKIEYIKLNKTNKANNIEVKITKNIKNKFEDINDIVEDIEDLEDLEDIEILDELIIKYSNMKLVTFLKTHTLINAKLIKDINSMQEDYNDFIEFIDEFLELVSKNECRIHHNLIQKYGVLSLKSGSFDIKKLIKQNEFEENKDYVVINVKELRPQGGRSNKNDYYLHPHAFKICLIRSLKTKKYMKYYLLLEKCIKYYNDYQSKLKEKYIIKLKNSFLNK